MSAAGAAAETRTLKLYFIHTQERAEITFKKDGRYIQSGLDQLNRFLRDWRKNEPTKMDPRLFDLVWSVYRNVGARDYIHVVSAYRSPSTNSMLRGRSRATGVAEKSQHMLGKAMDFFIPGVPLSKLRAAGFKAETGGVGFYPSSGSPFVHLDVGNVRAWPRMSRGELMALFPDGKTVHLPTDGRPLQGYNQALAAVQQRKRSGASVQMAAASESSGGGGFFSRLFGGGADDAEDGADDSAPAPAVVRQQPAPQQPLPGVQGARPAEQPQAPAAAPAAPTPDAIIAALPARSIPVPVGAPRPTLGVGENRAIGDNLYAANGTAQPAGWQTGPQGVQAPADQQVALNVPLPTRRPDYAPPAPLSPAAAAQVQLAAAQPTDSAQALSELARANVAPTQPNATLAAYLPVPSARPGADKEFLVTALPQRRPDLTGVEAAEAGAARAEAREMVDQRLAKLAAAPAASPKLAMIAREGAASPESALAASVRTTSKGARPVAGETRPDPRSVTIPVPRQVARWALSNEPVRLDTRGTKAPSMAYAAVRTAPDMVYTAGFQASESQADSTRFTGKAVQFMSVARFTTR